MTAEPDSIVVQPRAPGILDGEAAAKASAREKKNTLHHGSSESIQDINEMVVHLLEDAVKSVVGAASTASSIVSKQSGHAIDLDSLWRNLEQRISFQSRSAERFEAARVAGVLPNSIFNSQSYKQWVTTIRRTKNVVNKRNRMARKSSCSFGIFSRISKWRKKRHWKHVHDSLSEQLVASTTSFVQTFQSFTTMSNSGNLEVECQPHGRLSDRVGSVSASASGSRSECSSILSGGVSGVHSREDGSRVSLISQTSCSQRPHPLSSGNLAGITGSEDEDIEVITMLPVHENCVDVAESPSLKEKKRSPYSEISLASSPSVMLTAENV